MAYTKEQIIDMCDEASRDMKSFYKAKFINYKGYSKEKILYTEIVAEWLLHHLDTLKNIPQTLRQGSYNQNHTGEIVNNSNRVEETDARRLFKTHKTYEGFGEIIDYQTPLKNTRNDEGLGKIDLLSRNNKTKCVYILELKREGSEESMLRCVLEAYTYLRTVSKEKLFEDFGISSDYKLCASPLVYKGSLQHKEYLDCNRTYLHQLMQKLESIPFFIEENSTFHVSLK